jgi:hypothetical protein
MSYRYYAESIEVYNERTGEWSEQWLVSDDQREGISGRTFEWLFEVICKNEDHAHQVAKVFNSLIPAYQDFSQEVAIKAAEDIYNGLWFLDNFVLKAGE